MDSGVVIEPKNLEIKRLEHAHFVRSIAHLSA